MRSKKSCSTSKREFVDRCLVIFRRVLERELPEEELPESEMIEAAYNIIYRKIRHIVTRM